MVEKLAVVTVANLVAVWVVYWVEKTEGMRVAQLVERKVLKLVELKAARMAEMRVEMTVFR